MSIKLHYVCVVRWWFINSAIKLITVEYIYMYLYIKPKIKSTIVYLCVMIIALSALFGLSELNCDRAMILCLCTLL